MLNFSSAQVSALCDMYKVVPISARKSMFESDHVTPDEQLKSGIIFIDSDCNAIGVDRDLYMTAVGLYGINGDELNATFYKNFGDVAKMDRWSIFVDQIIHYLGTYGAEAMGMNPITIIPMQKLEVPDIDLSKIKVTIIRALSDGDCVSLINNTLLNTKAPSKRIVACMEQLIPQATVNGDFVKSLELAVMVFNFRGTVPTDAKMWLRYAIYKLTGQTLIIKNRKMINAIKDAADEHGRLCHDLLERANPIELSKIFLRYKPLFLAMKSHEGCAPLINRLRRLAETFHEPLPDMSVQKYIQYAMAGDRSKMVALRQKMDTRDMIKVLNAMLVRLNVKPGDPAVYNIRNGRAFCKAEAYNPLTRKERNSIGLEIDRLYDEIVVKLSGVNGKTYYIPDYIRYAAPQSEKQFVGNLPWGTVVVPDIDHMNAPMAIGIQWFNTEDYRVDLDLHAFSKTTHFGWNGAYHENGATVIYSGDMTNAPLPNGAAESFWVDGYSEPVIFTVNEYHGPSEMHFKLFFANERIDKIEKDWQERYNHPYTVDPNTLIMPPVPMYINEDRTYTIGFFHNGEFYCYSGNLSEGIVPSDNYSDYLEAVILQQKCHVNLAGLLERAGATIIHNAEARDDALNDGIDVIDLSPEALTATTLMDIVDGK